MVDSIAVLPPGLRITNALGSPASGAKLKFFAAGSTTPLTVYSDKELSVALGTTVFCDSSGYPVTVSSSTTKTLIYAGTVRTSSSSRAPAT